MKQAGVVSLLLIVSALTAGCGKGKPAFDPPSGWQMKEVPGLKFPAALGPPQDGFAPNINIVDEKFGGSLQAYVDSNLVTLRRMVPGVEIGQQEPFTTTTGLQAIRIACRTGQFGRPLRQVLYFFDGGSAKYVVTCTALASDQGKYDPIFEASLKTFQFK